MLRRILHPWQFRRAVQRRGRIPDATRQRIVNVERGYRLHRLAILGHPHRFRRGGWHHLDFSDTDWSGEDFSHADLRECDFSRCKFVDADLTDTRFWNATLIEADFSQARGLIPGHLAGADLAFAKLPKDLEKFAALDYVKSISENAAKVFLTLLALAAFIILTIASAQDSQLFLNTASTKLPVIGIDIPILGFYVAAPMLLLLLHLYLQIYLQRLWDALAALPAVFPDGRRLDESTFPWLINDLCRDRHPVLRKNRPRAARMQSFISTLLVWIMVPFTLWLIWANGLRAQIRQLTALHVVLFGAGLGSSLWFWQLMNRTFWARNFQDAKIPSSHLHRPQLFGVLIPIVVSVVLGCWSNGVFTTNIRDAPFDRFRDSLIHSHLTIASRQTDKFIPGTFWQRWGPHLLHVLGLKPYAVVDEVDFSSKPPTWTGERDKVEQEFSLVKGFILKNRLLRHVSARKCFLVKAQFVNVDIEGADFSYSDLRRCVFDQVEAQGADFSNVEFSETSLPAEKMSSNEASADIFDTNFADADLSHVKMEAMHLSLCEFRHTNFIFSQLSQSSFTLCSFGNNDFMAADLRGVTFNANIVKASFPAYEELGASLDMARVLPRLTDFTGVQFMFVHARDVDFGPCSMVGTLFVGAELEGANLSNAEGLTVQQLSMAKTLRNAKFPAYLGDALADRIKNDPSCFPESHLSFVPRRESVTR